MDYIMKNGTKVTHAMLIGWENSMMSEVEISGFLGISRSGLYSIRKNMGWDVRFRSDRGKPRVDPEDKRRRWNEYMKAYRVSHYDKCAHPMMRIGKRTMSKARYNATLYVVNRSLKDSEVVHHIDGDTRNNEPGNLMVFSSQGDHLKYHRGDKVESVKAEVI